MRTKWNAIALTVGVAVMICMAWSGVASAAPTTDITDLTVQATLSGSGGFWYWRNDAMSPTTGSGSGTFGAASGYVLQDGGYGHGNFAYTTAADGGGVWFDLGAEYNVYSVTPTARKGGTQAQVQGASLYGSATKSKLPDAWGTNVAEVPHMGTGTYVEMNVGWTGIRYVRIQDDDRFVTTINKLQLGDLRIMGEVPVMDNGYIGHVHGVESSGQTLVHYDWTEEAITNNRGMSDYMNPGAKDALHSSTGAGWISTADPIYDPMITFDLGGGADGYELDEMLIWNHNQTTVNNRGFQHVRLEYSDNNAFFWTEMDDMNGADPGNYTIDMAPVDELTGASLGDSNYQTAIDFGGLTADHVRITALSNWGDASYYGLAEVRFYEVQAASVPGDTNDDGVVDALDAATLAQNWLQTGLTGGASDGDFNEDGTVNDLDASVLAANWELSGEGVGVPEPSTVVLLITMALGGLWLRRRRR